MLVDLHDQFYQFYCADKKNRTDGRTDWQTDGRVKNIIPSATRCLEYNYFDMEIHEKAITKIMFMKDIFSFFQWLTIFAIELFNFINFWLNLLSSNSSASSTGNSGSKYLMTEENIWTDINKLIINNINKLNHAEFALRLQLGTWSSDTSTFLISHRSSDTYHMVIWSINFCYIIQVIWYINLCYITWSSDTSTFVIHVSQRSSDTVYFDFR